MIDEYQIEIAGIPVHCYEAGSGFPILFFHGSGAGVSIMSNFRRVLPLLATHYRVLGADLVGFGKSGLKETRPYFDMDLWVRQVIGLIDHSGADRVALVGHSLSGPIVLKAAARDPRVAAVFTTGTMGTSTDRIRQGPRWRFPDGREAVQAAVERTMYDPAQATPDEVERRLAVLSAPGYAEYFESMFGDDHEQLVEKSALTDDELAAISCPVVLLHGRNDRSFAPEETSLPLGASIADADVVVLARCAHSVAHERPEIFVSTVRATLDGRTH
jgi:2-hydroxymuconate-semialdehyde hydrolase